ncbi:MAG: GntR family transcriptional regulator [Oscillospiraceae bacterium]
MGFRQIQAPTLRELFVDQVIGMIFSGELKVGDRLPSERELSEQMHISRSMVHTGLEDLERMGFIRMERARQLHRGLCPPISDALARSPVRRRMTRHRELTR